MDIRERGSIFTRYIGLELKGAITARGFNAQQVASASDHSPAAFNRWLNGKAALPLSVLAEACEIIGIEPRDIVEVAYARLLKDHGPQSATAPANVITGRFSVGALDEDDEAAAARRRDPDPGEDY